MGVYNILIIFIVIVLFFFKYHVHIAKCTNQLDELTNAYTLISHTSNKLKNIPSPWKVVLCHSYQSLPETNSFDFDHNRLVLPTLEFRIDRIKQCVLLRLASAQHFWRFIDVIMGIGTTSFNNI